MFYTGVTYQRYVFITLNNYNGSSYATELQTALNTASSDLELSFTVSYDFLSNLLTITLSDDRVSFPDTMTVIFHSDESIINGAFGTPITNPRSGNEIISLTKDFTLMVGQPYYCYLDLHNTRNVYLTSSALASYDTVSNFGNDTIIKKIPVKAGPNELIIDNASEGFDYLNVSRRTLRNIDFQLVDVRNNILDLQNTHWSFSVVFLQSRN